MERVERMERSFSYAEYREIITLLKEHLPLMDFSEVTAETAAFCIIRHDVEFSIERAHRMAEIEKELGITTSFFFQLRNNTHNILSKKNLQLIRAIHDMGHKIGFHVNLTCLEDINKIEEYILTDLATFEKYVGIPIDRFSYHRPPADVLALDLTIPGKINTYDKKFFHFFQGKPPEKLRVTYIADSMHRWNYGHPRRIVEEKIARSQILLHPDEWSEEGLATTENFLSVIAEHDKEYRESIDNECKYFPKELLQ